MDSKTDDHAKHSYMAPIMKLRHMQTTGDWELHAIIINSELSHPPYIRRYIDAKGR